MLKNMKKWRVQWGITVNTDPQQSWNAQKDHIKARSIGHIPEFVAGFASYSANKPPFGGGHGLEKQQLALLL